MRDDRDYDDDGNMPMSLVLQPWGRFATSEGCLMQLIFRDDKCNPG